MLFQGTFRLFLFAERNISRKIINSFVISVLLLLHRIYKVTCLFRFVTHYYYLCRNALLAKHERISFDFNVINPFVYRRVKDK